MSREVENNNNLANANSHASDSIPYWIHATVPTMDRFAPIGDQARSSVPDLYDYHRRLVLEARSVNTNPVIQNQATWWLNNISIARMGSGFNYRYDLLPAGTTATPPTDLIYHARGTGHLFARTGWTRDAMWLAIVAVAARVSAACRSVTARPAARMTRAKA